MLTAEKSPQLAWGGGRGGGGTSPALWDGAPGGGLGFGGKGKLIGAFLSTGLGRICRKWPLEFLWRLFPP